MACLLPDDDTSETSIIIMYIMERLWHDNVSTNYKQLRRSRGQSCYYYWAKGKAVVHVVVTV